VGFIDQFNYAGLDAVLEKGDGIPFLLVLDGIEDPRNLGALIRTADACGAWGVIIPKDRSAAITPAVAKSSAGAIFHIPVVRIANIPTTLRKIKERGMGSGGAAAEAHRSLSSRPYEPLAEVRWKERLRLLIKGNVISCRYLKHGQPSMPCGFHHPLRDHSARDRAHTIVASLNLTFPTFLTFLTDRYLHKGRSMLLERLRDVGQPSHPFTERARWIWWATRT
jgi:hypothetical protein